MQCAQTYVIQYSMNSLYFFYSLRSLSLSLSVSLSVGSPFFCSNSQFISMVLLRFPSHRLIYLLAYSLEFSYFSPHPMNAAFSWARYSFLCTVCALRCICYNSYRLKMSYFSVFIEASIICIPRIFGLWLQFRPQSVICHSNATCVCVT